MRAHAFTLDGVEALVRLTREIVRLGDFHDQAEEGDDRVQHPWGVRRGEGGGCLVLSQSSPALYEWTATT